MLARLIKLKSFISTVSFQTLHLPLQKSNTVPSYYLTNDINTRALMLYSLDLHNYNRMLFMRIRPGVVFQKTVVRNLIKNRIRAIMARSVAPQSNTCLVL